MYATVTLAGPLGRALALGTTILLLLVLWLGIVQPLRHAYRSRAEQLDDRREFLARMIALVDQAPDLRQQAAIVGARATGRDETLSGETDGIAGAHLQEIVQNLAAQAGLTLGSLENLPASPAGRYRRLGLRISFQAPFPAVVHLLQAVQLASPRLLVDDLTMGGGRMIYQPVDIPLQVELTVFALYGGPSVSPDRPAYPR